MDFSPFLRLVNNSEKLIHSPDGAILTVLESCVNTLFTRPLKDTPYWNRKGLRLFLKTLVKCKNNFIPKHFEVSFLASPRNFQCQYAVEKARLLLERIITSALFLIS